MSVLRVAGLFLLGASVLPGPAAAQGFDGNWKGEFKIDTGAPSYCLPSAPMTVSVLGVSIALEVAGRPAPVKVTGFIRPDGSWEASYRLPDGNFATFVGQFSGRGFSGTYGAGTGCPGTFSGSKA